MEEKRYNPVAQVTGNFDDDVELKTMPARRYSGSKGDKDSGSLLSNLNNTNSGEGSPFPLVRRTGTVNRFCHAVYLFFINAEVTVRTWVYLAALGCLTALTAWVLDELATLIKKGRAEIRVLGFWSAYPLSIVWGVFFTCLAIFMCKKLSVYAKGSGTPEMKTILAGTMILGPLSVRCFVAKLLGLVFGMGAGLSIGKEGPFIHMACILGYQLTGFKYFQTIRKNERLLRQMIAAAVSAGITAAFGAPVGGVLFGIEVTVTYYFVNNLWRSYLCAIICIFVSKYLSITSEAELFERTELSAAKFTVESLFWFAVLGVLCGMGGVVFVYAVSKFQKLFNYTLKHVSAYILGSSVVVLTVLVFFPLPFMQYDDIQVSNQMFKATPLGDSSLNDGAGYTWWTGPNVFVTLPAFTILKLVFTAAAVSLPLPCGLYLPMFVMGATFGRLYGEFLAAVMPDRGFLPASYAVVGAAAWVGGGTHTVSTAVIIFELTGQLNHMIPVLGGVLIARAIAPAFSVPIYDLLMSIKALPYLPAAKLNELYNRTAVELIDPHCKYLTTESTYNEAYELLMATADASNYEEIAIVDPDTKFLVGAASRRALTQAIDNFVQQTVSGNVVYRGSADGLDEEMEVEEETIPTDGLFDTSTSAERRTPIVVEPAGEGRLRPMAVGEGRSRAISTHDAAKGKSMRENLDSMRHGLLTNVKEFFAPEVYKLESKVVVSPKKSHKEALAKNATLKDLFNERLAFSSIPISSNSVKVKMDTAPMAIPEATQLTKVHFIFTITHWEQLFVHDRGIFKGVIGKNEIAKESSKLTSLSH
jgi:chloride channel 2